MHFTNIWFLFLLYKENKSDQLSEMITSCLIGNVWNVQLAILQSLQTFVENSTLNSLNESTVNRIIKACLSSLADLKYSAIRSAAVDVLEKLAATGKSKFLEKTRMNSVLITFPS